MSDNQTIQSNTCHIWQADVQDMSSQLLLYESYLSVVEMARANRFVSARLRDDFILAHGWMRQVLAMYLCCEPEKLQFADNGHGKPMLESGDIRFNLSHSAGCVVLAVCRGVDVGVDVQFKDDRVDLLGIARRFFAPEEVRWLEQTPQSLRQDVFYRIWSLKEAYIKAVGVGMSLPLQDFAFGQGENDDVKLLRQPDAYVSLGFCGHVVNQVVNQDYALAVVAPVCVDQILPC